ncbi:tryptophan halogenase family protein [Polymorphobacter fuscus]|uniref:Tryptophan halogenase n=1 Tax=Sandarakinorhabdus fusca TaxID=1439888 RepID=A0A7C9KY16_9SPHN|nr:tryptophan halogenase family protein [Polymorphobacter fuscus]KAB7648827.1 tryptophan 7-halogenase [Polymorphobacter fuscus]MQT16408.1 tryptophan halogenase [Polymorphobacter fuscus]NJC07303.1 tryptophan halogenase [Polymorphobacter fuscus]
MDDSLKPVRRVVVAGGGTAGWIAATALARQLGPLIDITLVESDEIGTVGVGEATIPTAQTFHRIIGIDERAFMAATQSTFKLGIAFENWARPGDRYIHSFGTVGTSSWMGDFQHFWLQARAEGFAGNIGDYCLELQAAEADAFTNAAEPGLNYAYHLDASLYARFLRRIGETDGVRRVEGKITRVEQDGESGDITALRLDSGARIEGDLFIDCTGFRGLLIEQTLQAGYDDWSHWLPTNSALAVQTRSVRPAVPYTKAIAHDAGWRWQIPLQHRVGNGLVYCSDHLTDAAARDRLLGAVEGETLTEPRTIRYVTGRRRRTWSHNCIALGLSSGFVEPLESTSIHLIMIGVTRLMQLFPFAGITPAIVDRYNDLADRELEKVRDFIILHYKMTERDDSAFWRRCRDMDIPDTLAARIALFREGGFAYQAADDLFRVDSWVQVMLGQRAEPRAHHAMARLLKPGQLRHVLDGMASDIRRKVAALPAHQDFVSGYCPARGDVVPA